MVQNITGNPGKAFNKTMSRFGADYKKAQNMFTIRHKWRNRNSVKTRCRIMHAKATHTAIDQTHFDYHKSNTHLMVKPNISIKRGESSFPPQ